MQIDAYSSLAKLSNSSTSKDSSKLASDLDTFLKLLTAQLQHQDPTNPLDTNEFTQQLVQYSEVEQAIKSNQNLETLAKLSGVNAINGAVSYLGKVVTTGGKEADLANSQASWGYTAPENVTSAVFEVKDSSGNTVFSQTKNISKGTGEFNWNGRKTDGSFATSGKYSLSIQARNNQGGTVNVTTGVSGTVDGVDMSGPEPILSVNGKNVKISDVIAVKMPTVKTGT